MEPQPTAAPCPGCGALLHACALADGLLGLCKSCHGIWADNAFCQRMLGAALSEPSREWLKEIDRVARVRHESASAGYRDNVRPKFARDERKCPGCGKVLAQTRLPNPPTDVEYCRPHGVYFDRHELLAAAFETELRNAVLVGETRSFFTDSSSSTGPRNSSVLANLMG